MKSSRNCGIYSMVIKKIELFSDTLTCPCKIYNMTVIINPAEFETMIGSELTTVIDLNETIHVSSMITVIDLNETIHVSSEK